jgi:hypothetical protein
MALDLDLSVHDDPIQRLVLALKLLQALHIV